MGAIKVETFDVDVSDGSTHTLTNAVDLDHAFIRHISSTDKSSGGPIGSTANTNPNDAHMGCALTATNTITFYANTATSRKMIGEVWRYTGAGGPDEFIVRGRIALGTVNQQSNSVAVPGIVNRNKCVAFLTGVSSPLTSVNDYDVSTLSCHINASGEVEIARGSANPANVTAYITVVEFTGSNWTVGYGRSASHDSTAEIVTLNTDSDGVSGTTFSVPSWQSAFIEATMQGDTSETGLSDVLAGVTPGAGVTTVNFNAQFGDGGARNDGVAYIAVICNAGMSVTRGDEINFAEGNNSYGTLNFPAGSPTGQAIDEVALEWFVDTSGVGTAHARGRLNARITSTAGSGTIQHWVHRSGNNVNANIGVIDLTNVQDVVPVSISNGPIQIDPGDTNLVVTGTEFEAVQGTGTVVISDTATIGTGTDVTQSIDSWSDTSIQFDADLTGLADGTVYIIVRADAGGSASWQLNKGVQPYDLALTTLANPPDHYHTFNNTYDDEVGGLAANGQATAGTFGFVTSPLTRGRTHAWEVTGTGSRIEMADSAFTNVTNTHSRRLIAGWVRMPSVPLDPKGIWEEGGNVNNIYMVTGFGGKILCNVADSQNNFKMQAFSDFLLSANRTYHIAILFGCANDENRTYCFIDGVEQPGFDGDANGSAVHATHSGDWAYGAPDGGLDTGGTDINYPSFDGLLYNDWATWSNTGNGLPSFSEIRTELFEKGAVPDQEIAADTSANMQTAVDALGVTSYPDSTFAIKVNKPTDAANLTLTFSGFTFGDRTSIQLQWIGSGGATLTLINESGSNIDASKCSAPYGGLIVVQESVPVTITVRDLVDNSLIQGARVLIEAGSGGPLTPGDVIISGDTDVNGEISTNLLYSADQPITGRVRQATLPSTRFKTAGVSATIGANGLNTTVFMLRDE